jgi:hypothetical protein
MKKYFFLIISILPFLSFGQFDPSERSTSQKFDEVMDNILRFYVDPVNGKDINLYAII